MVSHNPMGTRLSALEQNILKYRAFEMLLILFLAEDLRECVLSSIRATDRFPEKKERLPEGTKNVYQKMWAVLVKDKIITLKESTEIQSLIDFRNDIGHRIHQLTSDINRRSYKDKFQKIKYDYSALSRITHLRNKIIESMGREYITTISFREIHFEGAYITYKNELKRLRGKIEKQNSVHLTKIKKLKDELSKMSNPYHPHNQKSNQRLTAQGIKVCHQLFETGKSPLIVTYAMRISLRSAKHHYKKWLKKSSR